MPYSVHLKQFDGPLDLLLHLIQESELDIKDIFVSEITAQYLSYMDQVGELDMDAASEFLTMAATLVYIKSRQLLPRPPKEEDEQEDPETVLIRQLQEYQRYKEATGKLRTLLENASGAMSRLPEDIPLPPKEILLDDMSADSLFRAFMELMDQKRDREERRSARPHVRADAFTVRSQMRTIRRKLNGGKTVRFEDLFGEDASKMEMIVTFMALLEMIAHGEIKLKQSSPFAPITMRAVQLREEDADTLYMDEEE